MKQPRKPKQNRPPAPAAKTPAAPTAKTALPFTRLQQDLLVIAFFLVVVILLHLPIFMNKQMYAGGDSQEDMVKATLIHQYQAETGEAARWNPYPEAGIPNVFFLPRPIYSLDFYLGKLGDGIGISIVYLLLGVIGMYYLLRYLKFGLLISVVVALGFILAPYYRSLIIVGQYLPAKFEAVMLIPWIVWPMLAFLDKMKWIYACFFALALSLQLLTQHYQVIFYTGLLLVAIGVYPLLRLLREKQVRKFLLQAGGLVLAFFVSLLLVAYPLVASFKYNQESIRGVTPIDINKPGQQASPTKGIEIRLINDWSPAPRELIDLLLPAASGGSSNETYHGSTVPEWTGQRINAYWGKMLFSFSYAYFGLVVLLALVALVFCRQPMITSLGILALLLLLWSLGNTLKGFYMFFYDYFPFFKNFRTPPTSLSVFYFIMSLLSAYGLHYLFPEIKKRTSGMSRQNWFIIAGFFAIGLLLFFIGSSLEYVKPGENYEAAYASAFQKARRELFMDDLRRYFILVALLAAIIVLHQQFRLISRSIALVLLGLVLIIDLTLINKRYNQELLDPEQVQARFYPPGPINSFFQNDKELYRVLPSNSRSLQLSAVVPTFSDNDLKVLTRVYELTSNCLYQNIDGITNINWNVLKIFGAKYMVHETEFAHPQLDLKFSDAANRDFVYQFRQFQSFGHFVKNRIVIPQAVERLKTINNAGFDPATMVILEEPLADSLFSSDSNYSRARMISPNEMEFDVYNNQPGLFVIPLPYVEDGWEIFMDNKKIDKVYIANHAMQAVQVPAGSHKLFAKFNERPYQSGFRVSAISTLLLYLLIGFLWWKERRNTKVEHEVHKEDTKDTK